MVADGQTPTVWVLLGKGAGGNGQLKSLAQALGWPYETKQLVYNRVSRCPNLLLGASVLGVDRRASSPLSPPWPGLVIAASRRSAPVARWIKKRSGGHSRLVHLMHTQAPLAAFDLIVTTPQYRLPARPNVLHTAAPVVRIDPDRLTAAAVSWVPRFAGLPRPYTALLVGGNSSSYVLGAETAARLGCEVSAQVRASGGSALVTTSARTPAEATERLFAALDCPAFRYRWQPGAAENPYLAYLALADRFVVTVDSAALLAEACTMGRPVEVFTWPIQPARSWLRRIVRAWGERNRHPLDAAGIPRPVNGRGGAYDRLVYWGLVKPPRDFGAYHRVLAARGLVTLPGAPADPPPRQPLDDMEQAVGRIREMFGRRVTHRPPGTRAYASLVTT
jgi:mitochondrial fission protein ELM1